MARKNTKTNHVLNLLAGNGEMEEQIEEKKKQENPPEVSEAANVNIQVVGSQKEDEKIVNTVNELLEKELEEELAGEGSNEPETAVKQEEPEPEKPAAVSEPESKPEEPAEAEKEPEPEPEEPVAAASEPEPEEQMMASEKEPAPEEPADSQELTDPEDIITVGLEPHYRFVNVMEKLVQEKVMFYMKQFGNCMCSRCVADTIALTLTHLPPKYEVIDRNAVAPLLNFYSQQYMGQITVEITKACTRVNEHPHHGRE